RKGTGQDGQYEASLAAAQLRGIDRDRLAPADTEAANRDQEHADEPDRIEMADGIQRHAALPLGRVVTQFLRRPGMGKLMERRSHDERDQDRDDDFGPGRGKT